MPERFEDLGDVSPEDRDRMGEIIKESEKILADATHTSEEAMEETLERGKDVLVYETAKELAAIRNSFERLLKSADFKKRFVSKFENEEGWTAEKMGDMFDALIEALDEMYRRVRFPAPNEHNPHPEGASRDTRQVLWTLIARHHGEKVADEAWPLVDTYVRLAHKLAEDARNSEPGENENKNEWDKQ